MGNIQLTRYYILSKNLWGATTAGLAAQFGTVDYSSVGSFVRENIIFSYFFPSIDPDSPFLPELNEAGCWMMGELRQEEFESGYIGSFAGTAVSAGTNTAVDGSLHEIEYISSHNKCDGSKQVVFTGYVFIKKGADYNGHEVGFMSGDYKLSEILSLISVGGERRYGFGRLQLDNKYCRPIEDKSILNGCWEIALDTDIVTVKSVKENAPFLAHCCISGVSVVGNLEPVVGREWVSDSASSNRKGAGQSVKRLGVCWVPGSTVKKNTVFKIGNYGIWCSSD